MFNNKKMMYQQNKIIFFIFYVLIFFQKHLIRCDATMIISEKAYPIILYLNTEYYNIITSNKIFIYGINANIQREFYSQTYNPPVFVCIDETNNYFLFTKDKYYKIKFHSNFEIENMNEIKSLSKNAQYVGYITGNKFNEISSFSGSRCGVEKNEIIAYGKNGKNINFYFINKNQEYSVEIDNELGNDISCKLIEDVKYICAYRIGNILKVGIFMYRYIGILTFKEKGIDKLNERTVSQFSKHTYPSLINTSNKNYKILCALDENNFIKCIKIYAEVDETILFDSQIKIEDISSEYYGALSFSIGNCYFIGYKSEYMFCCTNINVISCKRIDQNFNSINEFDIFINGENSYLTIINDGNNATLFFMNKNNTNKYNIYKYSIHPPICRNIIIEIPIFYNSENNLNNYFDNMGYSNYYFELENIPKQYLNIKLNGNFTSPNVKVKLNNIENKLHIFSESDNILNNLIIYYSISTEEKYSTKCHIDFSTKSCYYSCKKCFKKNEESNNDEHNCLECKDSFYPFSQKKSNCFTTETVREKKFSWFLNNITNEFELCSEKCATCNGPYDNNCLICKNGINENLFYLHNGSCVKDCPDGSFKSKDNEDNRFCEKCYDNCKTCVELGNISDMMCESCSDDKIIYKQNCYVIFNNELKTFYNPKNPLEITSCFELHNKYIIENTNKCIDKINEGYYISNNKTGLLSRCHSNCKTCSHNFTENNENCDSCNHGLLLQEGNCVQNCSEGYYLKNYKCLKCYDNCLKCENGALIEEERLIRMNCLECKSSGSVKMIKNEDNCFPLIVYNESKIIFNISEIEPEMMMGNCFYFNKAIFFGEYNCISKPDHTYYVIDNSENYGIVKYCDIACDSCLGENTIYKIQIV